MGKIGRPKVIIDKNNFEKLCAIQCTLEEIAGFYNCSTDTILRFCKREYKMTFACIYKKLSAPGKISLRRNQFKLAEKNVSMAIWLGKQYLNQKDYIENQEKKEVDDGSQAIAEALVSREVSKNDKQ